MASALEKEMEALLAGAGEVAAGADKAGKKAAKVRRKSKDLEEQLGDAMAAANLMDIDKKARLRRKSRDYADDDLKTAFDKHASDGKLATAKLQEVRRLSVPRARVVS